MPARFGPAGNADSFYEQGHKASLRAPAWLAGMGLDAYEYQCNKGVKVSADTAAKLGAAATESNIALSIHAPYYISLSSVEEEKRQKSVGYIVQTLAAAKNMGATRIVAHSGSCGSISRREAMDFAKKTLTAALAEAKAAGFYDIRICPETMGKINQLGTVEEVVELCGLDENLLPCIDFGHVNARGHGCLQTKADFEAIFDLMENKLGRERAVAFHSHYSRIEFTAGGEKTHHNFDETEYGPEFAPIAEIIAERGLSPTIICESRGKQAEDAVRMKEIYMKELAKFQ